MHSNSFIKANSKNSGGNPACHGVSLTVSLDQKLLSILVCPVCKGDLQYDRSAAELICRLDRLAYPINDDIPVMLSDSARKLSSEEVEKYR